MLMMHMNCELNTNSEAYFPLDQFHYHVYNIGNLDPYYEVRILCSKLKHSGVSCIHWKTLNYIEI